MPLSKAFEQEVAGQQQRIVEGVASTEGIDLQNEQVIQAGLDFSYFLQRGYVNWNHSMKPEDLLGVPLDATLRSMDAKTVFFIKARLFDLPQVDIVWNLMKALEPAGRRLGFSVQGSVRERRGGKILKSVIRHVSLTPEPINTETWANIAKALTTGEVKPLMHEDLETRITSILWGDQTECGHYDPQTRRYRSVRDAVAHLVKCMGNSPASARKGLALLRASGIFA